MSAVKKTSADSSAFLVCGDDEYLVGSKARELVDGIIPEQEQITALEVIDGNAGNAAEVAECIAKCKAALSSGGLFSDRKCVWVRDAAFADSGRVGQGAAAKDAVNGLVEFLKKGLGPDSFLVVSSGKVDKRSAFYKFFTSNGVVHEFATAKSYDQEKDAASFVEGRIKEMGLKISQEAQGYFLEKAGTSSRILVSEIEKLSIYVGDRDTVTINDIEAVTSSARTAIAWDLADAFGSKDLPRSLKVLRRLLYQGENEVGIIISLQSRIRDLLIYREAMDQGWIRKGGRGWYEWGEVSASAEKVFSGGGIKDPRSTHPFRVNILAGQAANFSARDLKAMLNLSIKAHERLVTSSDSKQNVLETLVVRLLRNRRKSGR